jgi:hypothetical protein
MATLARTNPKTAADERFEAYLVDHEIPYEYEPPWEERLGVIADDESRLPKPLARQGLLEVLNAPATTLLWRVALRPNTCA